MAQSRKKRTQKRRSFPKKKLLLFLSIAIFLIALGVLGIVLYNIGYTQGKQEALQNSQISQQPLSKKDILEKEKRALENILKPTKVELSEIEDYQQNVSSSHHSSSSKSISVKKSVKEGKLALIIDDVAFGYQVKALKSLHLVINPSFFPPSPRHPNTSKYAKSFKHYLIHLPMEAMHYSRSEKDTLLVTSSSKFIEKVVAKMRHDFPKAKFVNNHTGSKFTSDYQAMKRLIPILDKYGFGFIDSRTTPNTKVAQVQKEYHHPYIARNIFLDNKQDITYIQNQLKKAIKIAKRRGFAIAIGHPHPATIKALEKSKDILKQVKLVYIDEVY